MSKIFRHFYPRQIARHVKAFHQGSFYIEQEGPFRFERGLVCYDYHQAPDARQAVAKINRELRAMLRA